jgi:outer-membrane receptor for ferric coprogen and ferric-rhodotorulic acid
LSIGREMIAGVVTRMKYWRTCVARLGIVAAFVACWSATISSQDRRPYQVTGQVVDASGAAVVSAVIVVEEADGRRQRMASDTMGHFAAVLGAVGSVTVRAERTGFTPIFQSVRVDAQTPRPTLRLVLQPAGFVEDVTVRGLSPYAPPVASVGSKVPVSRRETPNSVSVLTRQQMNDQNMITTWDALSQITGVTVISNDSSQSQFHARGAALEVQQDGVPAQMPVSGYQQYDLAIYDRVEVLRGPAGLLQGAGNFSGAVNLVRRRPTSMLSTSIWGSTGRWHNQHVEAVVSGPLGSGLRGIAVFSGTSRDYFYSRAHDDKWLGYGVIEWKPASRTTVGVTTSHQQDRAPGFTGLPSYTDGAFLEVDRSFNPYPDWNRVEWDTTDVGVDVEQRLGRAWTATAKFNRRLQRLLFHDGFPQTGVTRGSNTADYARRESTFDHKSEGADLYLAGRFAIWGRPQELLAGANAARFDSEGRGVSGTQDPSLNVANVVMADPPALAEPADLTYRAGSLSRTDQLGVYSMLRSRLSDHVTTVIGGRWTNFDNQSRAVEPAVPTDWSQGAEARWRFTPYGGVVVKVHPQVSAYASYAEIFVPQTQRRVDSSILEPRIGGQYEAGVKGEHFGQRLLTSLAYFNIHDRNRSYPDPLNAGFFVPLGEVESLGWEGEITGRIGSGLDVTAGYTHLHTEYLVHPTLVEQPLSFWYPGHSFKSWVSWRARGPRLTGLRIGAGVLAAGKTASGTDTVNAAGEIAVAARRQGAYAVVNTSASYLVGRTFDVTLQVNNLFDLTYFTRLGGTNTYNWYGEPRNVSLSLRWQLARDGRP